MSTFTSSNLPSGRMKYWFTICKWIGKNDSLGLPRASQVFLRKNLTYELKSNIVSLILNLAIWVSIWNSLPILLLFLHNHLECLSGRLEYMILFWVYPSFIDDLRLSCKFPSIISPFTICINNLNHSSMGRALDRSGYGLFSFRDLGFPPCGPPLWVNLMNVSTTSL